MTCHFGILPADLLQTLSNQLAKPSESDEVPCTLAETRLLRLPHPRTGIHSLFLPHETPQSSSILEVQAVTPPNPRSWFMKEEVVDDGKLLVMTPVDPAFLLIPILQTTIPTDGTAGNFRPADDILEEAANQFSKSSVPADFALAEDILHLASLRCVHAAMRRVCEHKEVTAEITVYRYSEERVQHYLRAKVLRLSEPSTCELSRTINRNLAKDGLMEDGKETLLATARVRMACDLVSQYLPQSFYETLLSFYDFAPLDAYTRSLKEEAMALAVVNMNAVEASESKGQKDAGNDKKRKAKGSHGVEILKKANIKGMAKLSTFFQKK
ncbi:ribonuclease H2, subunit B [Trametes punicea]|nr:ribonuclease H2, subunit B [Trametes punicea]